MSYTPYRGGTIFIPTGPTGDHLFCILNDKCKDEQHLLVNFSSIKDGNFFDNTCVVEPGEHRFLRRQSYVNYSMADIQPAGRLSKMVDGWIYKPDADLSSDLLERICAGILQSRFIKRRVKRYFEGL